MVDTPPSSRVSFPILPRALRLIQILDINILIVFFTIPASTYRRLSGSRPSDPLSVLLITVLIFPRYMPRNRNTRTSKVTSLVPDFLLVGLPKHVIRTCRQVRRSPVHDA